MVSDSVMRSRAKGEAELACNPDDPRHGTCTGYNAYRCRCARCTRAKRMYDRGLRRRKGIPERRRHD